MPESADERAKPGTRAGAGAKKAAKAPAEVEGAVAKRAAGVAAGAEPAVAKKAARASVAKRAPAKGAAAKESAAKAKGAAAKGALAKGAPAKGVTAKASAAKESAPKAKGAAKSTAKKPTVKQAASAEAGDQRPLGGRTRGSAGRTLYAADNFVRPGSKNPPTRTKLLSAYKDGAVLDPPAVPVPIVEPTVERRVPPEPAAGGDGAARGGRAAGVPARGGRAAGVPAARPIERARAWLENLARLTPADAEFDRTSQRLRRTAGVILALGICGFLIDGANRPANPHLVQNKAPVTHPQTAVSGWGTLKAASLVVGGKHDCVVEALTTAEQNRGLMGRTTVQPYTGMAFLFAKPTNTAFYMKDTLIPLSVAWFDANGGYIGSAEMQPCPSTVATCPTFSARRRYTLAVEVPAGQLGAAGIGPGTTAHLGGPCA